MLHTMNPRKRGFADIQSDQSGFEPDPYVAPGIQDMNFGMLNQVPFQGGQMVPYIQQGPFGMPGNGFGNTYLDGTTAGQQTEDFGADDGYPVDQDLEKRITDAKSKKKSKLPPFVEKVATFVNDENNYDIIRWSDDGDSFIVLDEDRFSKELIPGVFKHNNFASFVRQLNMYNFHKKVGMTDGSLKASMDGQKARLEYEHKYFKRGHPDMLFLIEKPKAGRKSKSASGKKLENVKEESDDDIISDDDQYENDRGNGNAPRLIEDTPSGPNKQEFYAPPNPSQGGPSHVTNIKPPGPAQPYNGIHAVVDHIVSQLNELKSQQSMISTAITRLRQEHQQLTKQATAFQEMHDRHEMSISNILQFLASVYNKNIDGMNQNGMMPQANNSVIPAFGKHPAADLANTRPAKRTRYLIEDGRGSAGNRKTVSEFDPASEDGRVQDLGRLQELDTPTDKETPTVRHASVTPVATPGKISVPSTALVRNNAGMLALGSALSSTPVPPAPSDQELRSLEEHQAAVDQSLRALQQNVENLAGHADDVSSQFDLGSMDNFSYQDGTLDNWIAALSPGSLQQFSDGLKDIESTMGGDNFILDQNAIEDGVLNTHIDSTNGTPEPGQRVEEVDRGNGQTPEV
ncbi:stress-responsive transcription factor hsf1 [Orbilia blumenaviensis]|uniref:Stress-responsive transcription factor hsf1 n=1 Tax=Orbilia blumenaviensis TaxID=1796055 RepID=A0AAV9VIC1_9PEZI